MEKRQRGKWKEEAGGGRSDKNGERERDVRASKKEKADRVGRK